MKVKKLLKNLPSDELVRIFTGGGLVLDEVSNILSDYDAKYMLEEKIKAIKVSDSLIADDKVLTIYTVGFKGGV